MAFVDTALTPGDLQAYLGLVTSEHQPKPKFNATLAAALQPIMDTQAALAAMMQSFDIDTAIGAQLDVDGLWVGASRNLQAAVAGVYFAWDTAGVGWDQGVWLGPGESPTSLTVLPDGQYRTLIRARIANNQWDGTIPQAYAIGSDIFGQAPSTQFIFRSNVFTTAGDWAFVNATTAPNATTSPDQTVNAWNLTRTDVNLSYMRKTINQSPQIPVGGRRWSISICAKPNTGNFVALRLDNAGAQADAVANVGTGLITTAASGTLANPAATLTALPNGFYRFTLAADFPAGSTIVNAYIANSDTNVLVGQVDGAPQLFIYGAQLEPQDFSGYVNDIAIKDNQDMTMTIYIRGPALDALTKAMITSGAIDLSPAGVLATYVQP